ncbi:hypothetical protein CEXT_684991 [Caerostris extrusa]|uniref:Uncharacterized protein n=1 Tax=Caerostris extrusa TaxID=172846 RepID=A0AAV4V0H0_CAEEX|nr:hypothetical protein CEXT_684991 [Caerostris extrusa]
MDRQTNKRSHFYSSFFSRFHPTVKLNPPLLTTMSREIPHEFLKEPPSDIETLSFLRAKISSKLKLTLFFVLSCAPAQNIIHYFPLTPTHFHGGLMTFRMCFAGWNQPPSSRFPLFESHRHTNQNQGDDMASECLWWVATTPQLKAPFPPSTQPQKLLTQRQHRLSVQSFDRE